MEQIIELQLTNTTPARFLAYVRYHCKVKDIPVEIPSAKEFANYKEDSLGDPIHGHDGFMHDFWYTKPYAYQTCTINEDGTGFNEICEFEFDDERTGHGYYYCMNNYKEEENEKM